MASTKMIGSDPSTPGTKVVGTVADPALVTVMTIPEIAADPTPVAATAYVYSKDSGGETELFFEDDVGNVNKMSPAAEPLETFTFIMAQSVNLGEPLRLVDTAGVPRFSRAGNATEAEARFFGVSLINGTIGVAGSVQSEGANVPIFLATVAADMGKAVYLGALGAYTLTKPTASGTTALRVGYITLTGASGVTRMIVSIGNPILN